MKEWEKQLIDIRNNFIIDMLFLFPDMKSDIFEQLNLFNENIDDIKRVVYTEIIKRKKNASS